jgi:hypothetical protein
MFNNDCPWLPTYLVMISVSCKFQADNTEPAIDEIRCAIRDALVRLDVDAVITSFPVQLVEEQA